MHSFERCGKTVKWSTFRCYRHILKSIESAFITVSLVNLKPHEEHMGVAKKPHERHMGVAKKAA
jgi:hypothetical protein